MTKPKSVLAGIFRQPEKSPAEQFVYDTLGGVEPEWSEGVVQMLEAHRAELGKQQSAGLASGLRWAAVAAAGIVLLDNFAASIPGVVVGIIQVALLTTALALPSALGQAFAAWRTTQQIDVVLGTARWVLANPPRDSAARSPSPSTEAESHGERRGAVGA